MTWPIQPVGRDDRERDQIAAIPRVAPRDRRRREEDPGDQRPPRRDPRRQDRSPQSGVVDADGRLDVTA